MSAVVKTRLTPEEYLAIDRKASVRSEYFHGEMFAMAGASHAHNVSVRFHGVGQAGDLHQPGGI